MGKTSAAAKNKWNKANYKQIKICAPPEIALAFKAACVSDNVSMSGEIIGFMKRRGGSVASSRQKKDSLTTRDGRRKKLYTLIGELELIRDAEQEYKDNIPENLQNSIRYEAAEECVSVIEDAIESLIGAF